MIKITKLKLQQKHPFWRMLKLLGRHRGLYFFGLIGDTFIAASFPIAIAMVMKWVFDAVNDVNLELLQDAVILLAIMFTVQGAIAPLFSYMVQKAVKLTTTELSRELQNHVQQLPITYFEQHHSGDTLSRMTLDVRMMEQAYGQQFRSFLVVLASGFGSIAFMLTLHWKFTLLLFAVALLSFWTLKKLAHPIRLMNDRIQSRNGLLAERLSDILAGMQTMRMFQIEREILGRYESANEEMTAWSLREGRLRAWMECANFVQGFLSFTGIILLGMFMVIQGTLPLGTLMAMVQLQSKGVSVFFELGNTISNMQGAFAGAARVFALLDQPPEKDPYAVEIRGQTQMEREAQSCHQRQVESAMIRLDDLHFAYDSGAKALNGMTLSIPRGAAAAFVGPSGSGKSTLLKLLLGFYRPTQGGFTIAGKPLSTFTLAELRSQMAYVPQDGYLFDGTIRDNIRYGRWNATDDEIREAALHANAHDFIMGLPEQYGTAVGERGSKLSGGQRQRIAIARAMLTDAPILLLDEATSALDTESEHAVQAALQRLMQGRTTIIVAHRLSTIEYADVIYVLDRGHLVEQGNHKELLAQDGLYRKLYAQANLY